MPTDLLAVYLEAGTKRVFASAVDWPGWSRGGRDRAAALATLVAYGPRYRAAIGAVAAGLAPPSASEELEVIATLEGGSGTDFGVPSRHGPGDEDGLDPEATDRLAGILEASWTAFDRAAAAAVGIELAKGPRGGGRDLAKIVSHVWEADIAYHQSLGHPYRPTRDLAAADDMARLRASALGAFRSRAAGEPLPPSRRTSAPWPPRYYVRRAAWHALDHAWEIEDRSGRAE